MPKDSLTLGAFLGGAPAPSGEPDDARQRRARDRDYSDERRRRGKRMSDDEIEAACATGLAVRGDTFPVKDELKLLGCGWSQKHRTWVAPDDLVLAEALEIVKRGPVNEQGVPQLKPVQLVTALRAMPSNMLVSELRRRGVNVKFEAETTLADAIAGWPPTMDDLAPAFDFSELDPDGDRKEEP